MAEGRELGSNLLHPTGSLHLRNFPVPKECLHRTLAWVGSTHEIALDVDDGPSPWPEGCEGSLTWPQAQELKAELHARAGFKMTRNLFRIPCVSQHERKRDKAGT